MTNENPSPDPVESWAKVDLYFIELLAEQARMNAVDPTAAVMRAGEMEKHLGLVLDGIENFPPPFAAAAHAILAELQSQRVAFANFGRDPIRFRAAHMLIKRLPLPFMILMSGFDVSLFEGKASAPTEQPPAAPTSPAVNLDTNLN